MEAKRMQASSAREKIRARAAAPMIIEITDKPTNIQMAVSGRTWSLNPLEAPSTVAPRNTDPSIRPANCAIKPMSMSEKNRAESDRKVRPGE